MSRQLTNSCLGTLPMTPTLPERANQLRRLSAGPLDRASIGPYSPAGFDQLRRCIEEYIDAITAESSRVARRAQADTISAAHVDDAARHLLALRGRRFFRHLGTVGGLLLGTAMAQTVAMASNATITSTGLALAVVLGIVGAFAVALHIGKD